jgi:hypothetical protein
MSFCRFIQTAVCINFIAKQDRKYMYKRNTEARSRNNGCRGKAISVTYWSVCVCVRLIVCVHVGTRARGRVHAHWCM